MLYKILFLTDRGQFLVYIIKSGHFIFLLWILGNLTFGNLVNLYQTWQTFSSSHLLKPDWDPPESKPAYINLPDAGGFPSYCSSSENVIFLDPPPAMAARTPTCSYRRSSAPSWTASSNTSESWALARVPQLLVLRITAGCQDKYLLLVRSKTPFVKHRLS